MDFVWIVVAVGFGVGFLLFCVYYSLRRMVRRGRKPVTWKAALALPLIVGGVFGGLLHLMAVRNPGPTGEVAFVAGYLSVFGIPPLIFGSLVAFLILSWLFRHGDLS